MFNNTSKKLTFQTLTKIYWVKYCCVHKCNCGILPDFQFSKTLANVQEHKFATIYKHY